MKLSEKLADNETKRQQQNTIPHVIIEARAGTGKTTTLIEGLKLLKGITPLITPSPQQQAVWDLMLLSKDAATIGFVAFNKSIAEELKKRVPEGCTACTMHSLGFSAVKNAFGANGLTDGQEIKMNKWRVSDIISELLERDIRELRKHQSTLVKATEKLVSLCKMNLTGNNSLHPLEEEWEEWLLALAAHYDVDLNGSENKILQLVPKVLERCLDVARDGCIDFNDMIWIPVALGLSVSQYDLLLIDEAQDLNRCQQALAKMSGQRLIFCGDSFQAIYGFAGADSESMKRLEKELAATDPCVNSGGQLVIRNDGRGCVTLPLTVTYRCGKAIVAEANKIVPDFHAHESNGEGKVTRLNFKDENQGYQCLCEIPGCLGYECPNNRERSYTDWVQDKDMILCRVNAPLVSQCFRFLKAGRKANIQGRDIGQGLISTINKQKADSIEDLDTKLLDWKYNETLKESDKRNPSDARIILLQDRYDCLMHFIEDCQTIEEVIDRIKDVFTDDKELAGILLSSGHRAKGLEADRVFILRPRGAECPHPMAKSDWQKEQEMNILYVMITRAKKELIWVS